MQSASFGPPQSALRTHSEPAASRSTCYVLCTSGTWLGSGLGWIEAGAASRAGDGRRPEAGFVRGDCCLVSSGSSPRLATTAMTKHATTRPPARGHQILLSVTTGVYLS